MSGGEVADGGAHAAQAVEASGGERAGEAELFEQRGLGGDDVGRRGVGVEVAEQPDQAAHERRIGVAGEVHAAVACGADDPRGGDAAADAVRVGARGGVEGRAGFGAVDDEREAFLRVVDDEEIVDEKWRLSASKEYFMDMSPEFLTVNGAADFARAIEQKLKEKNA